MDPALAAGAGLALVVCSLLQARSTWCTPPEWASLPDAAHAVHALVSPGDLLVAPEALLYAADRRGCRLELDRAAARRAAGEWGSALTGDSPLSLVEFYKARGARFVAIPGVGGDQPSSDPGRLALQEAIRRRYNVLVDGSVVLIEVWEVGH